MSLFGRSELAALRAAHTDALLAKDAEIARLSGQVESLQAKLVTLVEDTAKRARRAEAESKEREREPVETMVNAEYPAL